MSNVSQVVSETASNLTAFPDLNLGTLFDALQDKDVKLLVPESDVTDPEISIVIPALKKR